MSDTSTHLLLPYLLAAQAQKHVTHNEALRLLDGLVQLSVLDRHLTTPPASPADGARYIVASGATGPWSGWDLNIAYYVDGAWMRLVPREGWLAWVGDEDLVLAFDGSAWSPIGGDAPSELQNLDRLGLGTTADAANPFAARLNAALWTAKSAADGGTGDVRFVVNKEASADTASFLFQVGFSGRAEFGLTGSDLFGIKVSPDGASWVQALTIDAGGRWLSGVDLAVPVFPNDIIPSLQLHGSGIGQTAMLGVRWSNDGNAPQYILAKSRSTVFGSVGSPVQSGDILGSYVYAADNGAQLVQAAEVRALATGNWSTAAGRSARLEVRLRDQDALAARARLDADGSLRLLNLATTASGANAFLNAGDGNNLLRSTSSVRYKRDVQDIAQAAADRVLSLRPVRYRSTAEADRADWSYYGLVAEEVAAIDPRLVHWAYPDAAYDTVVELDPDSGAEVARRVLRPGAEQVPEGVQYDRVAVLLLGIVKRQEARIAALEARLAGATLADLT